MSKLQQWVNSQGSTALWVVFWLYGVVLSNVLFGLILVAFNKVAPSLFGLMLLGFVAYTACMLNAVWRNADNVSDPSTVRSLVSSRWPGRSTRYWFRAFSSWAI